MRIQKEHDEHLTTEIGAGVLHDVTADEFLVSASVYGVGRDGKPVKFLITMTERELDQLTRARNANLIAAAPELLAVVRHILELCDADSGGAHWLTKNDTTRALCRAAIAKAGG